MSMQLDFLQLVSWSIKIAVQASTGILEVNVTEGGLSNFRLSIPDNLNASMTSPSHQHMETAAKSTALVSTICENLLK